MACIELADVAHSYVKHGGGESDYALKRIDTVWDDGGAYALLGPSGCGKTTLLNIISGLLTPSEGKVLYDGRDVTEMAPEKRNIAQVFQFPVLYDTMSVYDNLAFPLKNRRVNRDAIDRRVREVADILELTHVLSKKASGLSADAKQKISLGRGLVREDVAAILFDEPLTVIDPHLKWLLRRKLKEIHRKTGVTFVYVTHDQVEAMTFAEKVVVMKEGRILQTGTPVELFENPAHTFVGFFIGSPGMNFLPVTVDGNAAICDGNRFLLDGHEAVACRRAKGTLQIGIRPMYVELAGEASDHAVAVDILGVQDLGHCRIVRAALAEGGRKIAVRVPEGKPVPQNRAWASFPKEWIRVYEDDCLIGQKEL